MSLTMHSNPRKIALGLLVIVILLAILGISFTAYEWSLGVNNTYLAYQLSEIFSLNHEGNIPTWYSSSLLFTVTLLSALIAQSKAFKQEKGSWQWRALGLLFLYLTLDESAALHESFTSPIRESFNLSGYLYFSWILVGIPAVLLIGLFFLPFVLSLPRHTKYAMVVAAIIYLAGSIGVETISANIWYLNDGTSLLYSGIGTIEETLEMLGVITLIYGLLVYIRDNVGQVTISLQNKSKNEGTE